MVITMSSESLENWTKFRRRVEGIAYSTDGPYKISFDESIGESFVSCRLPMVSDTQQPIQATDILNYVSKEVLKQMLENICDGSLHHSELRYDVSPTVSGFLRASIIDAFAWDDTMDNIDWCGVYDSIGEGRIWEQ